MKITTVIENNKEEGSKLECEHGLSYFIEAYGLKILFDTGQSEKTLSNFKKLGLSLENIDYIILSHGHYDHAGGFKYFLENINNKPYIILGNEFFERSDKYHLKSEEEKYIGINFDKRYIEEMGYKIIEVKEKMKLEDRIYVISNLESFNEEKISKSKDELSRKEKNILIKDNFSEELVLVIENVEGLTLITGCAHTGIINIITKVQNIIGKKVINVIGGIHLSKLSLSENIETAKKLKELNIKNFSLCHCSGNEIINILKDDESEIIEGFTGKVIQWKFLK
ncbi:MBL fold metallo-hydrolase [Clostridium sardiniense]|uniref:MBL fold metallo-hydrolase n=1 Tax=Clostridium sardiniense TaxID=29369 RepID=A0ABS7KY12_CLOSR|nr:MBL fold metallo-hydrolase [Clostridium sardiniense]MBY0755452.1 MBL fold metallo-hydrolase [Clostridium sardiniense]MDQ0461557.1 7,8-dihydropterin-6-yl-methyl-4-(beta-D-ribofuranosyl)aminobenzene 5'-phosphate synthase [Clostridium sardiniense]